MKAISFVLRTSGLVAGAALAIAAARAAETDALPTFDNNFVKLSATDANVNGSRAAYQARTQNAKTGAVGIEELRYGYDLKNNTTLQIDGRALAGQEDYLLSFKLAKEEVGSFEVGYKTFRTYYDGAGGFFPIGNTWMPIFDRPLYVDRGSLFLNATVALPNAPVFTFRFASDTRNGRKDSTIWGGTNFTGIPVMRGTGATNPVSSTRKILPSYIDVDERNDHWTLEMRHKIANTTAVVSIGGNRIDNTNIRPVVENVGEVAPYPAPSYSTPTQIPAAWVGSEYRALMTQGTEEQGFHAGATVETVLTDKVTLFGGVNYHTANIDITGSRVRTDTFLATGVGVLNVPNAFAGGSNSRAPYLFTSKGELELDVVTANLGVRATPMPDLFVETSIRGERATDSGVNVADYFSNEVALATGVVTKWADQGTHRVDNTEKPWTPTLDVRYTGIRNVALYASWEYRTSKQDERVQYQGLNGLTRRTELDFISNNIKENHSNATVGANWTVTKALSLRAEFFTKDHENDFTGYDASLGDAYGLNYDIYGTKVTAVVKPLSNVSLTSRYVLQRGKAAVYHLGLASTTAINGWVDGNDSTRHQFAETITWNPTRTVYVQANGTVVFDQIQTMYPWVTGAAKTNLRNTDNNYVTSDLTVGFAVDKKTDARLQATYYRANNYEPAYAAVAMPYGASAKEYSVTAGIRRKLSAKTVLGAKLGYLDSENSTRGGFADFSGPVGYLTLEHAF